MMLKIACMLGLLGAIQAMSVINAQNEVHPKPAVKKGCCLPKQYTVKVADMVYYQNTFTTIILDYSADDGREMIAYRIYSVTGKLMGRAVQDFSKGAMYYIHDGMCNSTKIPAKWTKQCIPDEAQYISSSYIGLDPKGFTYDIWMITQGPMMQTIELDKDCFPMGSQVTIKHAENDVQYVNLGYYNGTDSIVDPSMFDVPSSCTPPQGDIPALFAALEKKPLLHHVFRK